MTQSTDQEWFQQFRRSEDYKHLQARPVAYFCAEFALADRVPTFAGGLGVLSGDVVREAADQQLPMVAVGLFYHEGYVCQQLDSQGNRVEKCLRTSPQQAGLRPVTKGGQRLMVKVPIQDRQVMVQAWVYRQHSVPVYLLDTNLPENESRDQQITNRLYTADKEMRFKQEMVLGIGGWRLLETLKVHPGVYHLNEGHSALLALEIAQYKMRERLIGFRDACEFARRQVSFTNHTLLAAGNDVFSNDLVAALLSGYAEELQIPVQELVELGLVQETSLFSLTMLSLRLAGRINAVSKLHAQKAAEIWVDHPMVGITNGVHVPTWDQMKIQNSPASPSEATWEVHQRNKRRLLERIRQVTGQDWNENHLFLGWARRMVEYKRPTAIISDIKRLSALAGHNHRPLRLMVAGGSHHRDEKGAKLLRQLQGAIQNELKGMMVYLPDYDLGLAGLLTSGCDVWLNTPVVGFEACGTSGMKAALNGVLPVTTKDGWADEVELFGVGWKLDSDRISDSLYEELEKNIVPMYYQRDGNNLPARWVEHMTGARQLILSYFDTTRMLREYVEKLYLPSFAVNLPRRQTGLRRAPPAVKQLFRG